MVCTVVLGRIYLLEKALNVFDNKHTHERRCSAGLGEEVFHIKRSWGLAVLFRIYFSSTVTGIFYSVKPEKP